MIRWFLLLSCLVRYDGYLLKGLTLTETCDVSALRVVTSPNEVDMHHYRLVLLTLVMAVLGGITFAPMSAAAAQSVSSPAASASTALQQGQNDDEDGVADSGHPFKNIPVTGTTPNGGTFKGKLTITGFSQNGTDVLANGVLRGTERDARGKLVKQHRDVPVSWPVDLEKTRAANGIAMEETVTADMMARAALQQPSCSVLTLVLGPLHLDLLGLVVDLNQVNLLINAVPGAGALLGNLLCGVLGLLNPLGALTDLVNALNTLLNFFN